MMYTYHFEMPFQHGNRHLNIAWSAHHMEVGAVPTNMRAHPLRGRRRYATAGRLNKLSQYSSRLLNTQKNCYS
jgi:hypothetical protein